AGRRLNLTGDSLVERAAQEIDARRADAIPAEPAPHTALEDRPIVDRPTLSAEPRRHTQRHITLDHARLKALGYTAPGDQSSLAEEFRIIKRPLLDFAFGRSAHPAENRNIIMVTSAGPNEGKTFVSVNLALSIASEHEVRVLLIDADVAKPSVPR